MTDLLIVVPMDLGVVAIGGGIVSVVLAAFGLISRRYQR